MTAIGPASLLSMPLTDYAGRSASSRETTNVQETQVSEAATNATLIEDFLKWAQMSPEERIRAQYLEEEGLTEEALQGLSAEERQAVEDEIAALIEEKLGLPEERTAQADAVKTFDGSLFQVLLQENTVDDAGPAKPAADA